jgi:3-oxoacyl-[acyl-carrier-protein] synthase II
LGVIAAQQAIRDANLGVSKEESTRIGVVIGTSIGGLGVAEEQHALFLEKGYKRINPFMQTSVFTSSCSSYIAMYFNLHGPAESVSTACASSNTAVGLGMQRIRSGECDVVLAGGSDAAITPFILGSFCVLRLVSRRNEEPSKACKPFSLDRDGLVLSEGSAVLVLEEATHALKRNAQIYGELIGYGASCDAYHITSPHPDATYAVMAMEKAVQDAGIDRNEIEYINAHGSATEINDRVESMAINEVFGKRGSGLPVSATKSMIGHTMGACGSLELAACFLMLQHGYIHPTINHSEADPECNINCVPNESMDLQVTTMMSNSFGYGGQNSVIILRRFNP